MQILKDKNNCYSPQFEATIKIKKPTKEQLIKSGLLTSGTASSVGGSMVSAGSYMDQSVHYPMLGSQNLPQWFLDFAKDFPLQKWAYSYLYKPTGIGNQTAVIPGTIGAILTPIGLWIRRIGAKISIFDK